MPRGDAKARLGKSAVVSGLRLLWLHLKSRAPVTQLVSLPVTVALAWLAAGEWRDPLVGRFLLVVAPLIPAAAAGIGLHSVLRPLDRITGTPVVRCEVLHIVAYGGVAALALALPAAARGGVAPADLLTNLAGYLGLVLLWATVADARLSWMPTAGYGLAVYLPFAQAPERLNTVLLDRPWLWPVSPATAASARAAETALLLIGLAAYLVRARRA